MLVFTWPYVMGQRDEPSPTGPDQQDQCNEKDDN